MLLWVSNSSLFKRYNKPITVTTTKTCLYADVYSASGPCHRKLTLFHQFRQFRQWQNTRSIISSRCKRTHRQRGHMAEKSTDHTPHRSLQPLCGEVPSHRRPNPLIPHQSLVHIPRYLRSSFDAMSDCLDCSVCSSWPTNVRTAATAKTATLSTAASTLRLTNTNTLTL